MCGCGDCNYFKSEQLPSVHKMILRSLRVLDKANFTQLCSFMRANYQFGYKDYKAIIRKHLINLVIAKKVGVLLIKTILHYVF